MGWAGLARSLAAEARRQERDARRRAREAEKAWQAAQKAHAAEAARLEVESFEAHLDELTSIHRESVGSIDWAAVARRADPPAPVPPSVDVARSTTARADLDAFTPGFFEKLFGLTGRRTRLEGELREALAAERAWAEAAAEHHARKVASWREDCAGYEETRALARRVLTGDVAAFGDAIRGTGCLNELMQTLGASNLL